MNVCIAVFVLLHSGEVITLVIIIIELMLVQTSLSWEHSRGHWCIIIIIDNDHDCSEMHVWMHLGHCGPAEGNCISC